MARRHTGNLNNRFKLNIKLVYDYMERNKLNWVQLGEEFGCHEQTAYNFCKNQRIPKRAIFNKMIEKLGLPEEQFLIPLTGGRP